MTLHISLSHKFWLFFLTCRQLIDRRMHGHPTTSAHGRKCSRVFWLKNKRMGSYWCMNHAGSCSCDTALDQLAFASDLILFWQPTWLLGKKTRGPDWIELMETVMDRHLLHYASMGCNVFIWVSAWRAVPSRQTPKLQREDLGIFKCL